MILENKTATKLRKCCLNSQKPAGEKPKSRQVLRAEATPESQVWIGKTGQHKEDVMRRIHLVLLAMILALPFAATATASAQVGVGIGVGPAVVPAPV